MSKPRNILIVGSSGSGKSTVSKKLSQILGLRILILCLLWSSQAWAGGGREDSEKIEKLAVAIKKLDPVNFDAEKARTFAKESHLDLTERPDDVLNLYTDIIFIARGAQSFIYKAILAHDRPHAGLKKGDMIALRVVSSIPKPLSKHYFGCDQYEALIRLSKFKKLDCTEQPLTDCFPNFYGVYFGGDMPESIASTIPDCWKISRNFCNYRFEEMEWIDSTFAKAFGQDQKIPDSVIFEFLFGEWAGQFFLGITVGDPRGSNYGLKRVDHARCYHLGDCNYYFSSQMMPMRIDLETFHRSTLPSQKRFYNLFLVNTKGETQAGNEFLNELNNKFKGVNIDDLFTLFKRYFSAYIKEPGWVERNDPTAKHFYLDQKHIDYEKSLP